LVAEALARSRRHDQQDIAAGSRSLADLALMRAKIAMTEDAVQEILKW
jgi:hypothetical protein